MPESIRPLMLLKRRLEQLERPRSVQSAGTVPLGCDALDARLGGGLARGALHEICAVDPACASGFTLMLAARAACTAAGAKPILPKPILPKPILWVREDKGERMNGGLYAPGLIELGVNPDQIILINAPDTLAALRVGADILGCMALGAAVIEPFGVAKALDLTASRRLVLAAEKSGVAAFLLRGVEGWRVRRQRAGQWPLRPHSICWARPRVIRRSRWICCATGAALPLFK
jgi:protein ImuA